VTDQPEMIERVAREMAIQGDWHAWDTAKDHCDTPSGNTPEDERDHWRDLARAAIAAMREPTNLVLDCLANTSATVDINWTPEHKRRVLARAQWNHAIDAALEGK